MNVVRWLPIRGDVVYTSGMRRGTLRVCVIISDDRFRGMVYSETTRANFGNRRRTLSAAKRDAERLAREWLEDAAECLRKVGAQLGMDLSDV